MARVSRVQSVVLKKIRFKTMAQARSWAKDNGFKTSKVDETDESFRFRQFDPSDCKGSFRSDRIARGVTIVLCIESK